MSSLSAVVRKQVESALATRHPSALTVYERQRPECFSSGIPQIDALTGLGGIPRGALTEICGPASSGRTSVMASLLAEVTRKEEFCALVDASDSFSPHSAEEAGVDLQRLLWVRCSESTAGAKAPRFFDSSARLKPGPFKTENPSGERGQDLKGPGFSRAATSLSKGALAPEERRKSLTRLEQVLKTTDQLLQSGGFGLIVVDLGDLSPAIARRVPLTSWFRFRRAVENTRTALVVIEQEAYARTCATLVLQLKATQRQAKWSSLLAPEFYSTSPFRCAAPFTHSRLLRGLEIEAEVMRARVGGELRKPPASVLATQTEWNISANVAR